jgi:hypothetical protein
VDLRFRGRRLGRARSRRRQRTFGARDRRRGVERAPLLLARKTPQVSRRSRARRGRAPA